MFGISPHYNTDFQYKSVSHMKHNQITEIGTGNIYGRTGEKQGI